MVQQILVPSDLSNDVLRCCEDVCSLCSKAGSRLLPVLHCSLTTDPEQQAGLERKAAAAGWAGAEGSRSRLPPVRPVSGLQLYRMPSVASYISRMPAVPVLLLAFDLHP